MIAGIILEHYLNVLPPIKSFFFAMFKPYFKVIKEPEDYKTLIKYVPTHPIFEVRVPNLLSETSLCQYLEKRFENFRKKIREKEAKKKGVLHSPIFGDHPANPDYVHDGYIEEQAFGFVSKVKLESGKIIWLRLIDFNCPISDENLKKVEIALKLLRVGPGLIVNSGNSYHFYGEAPFNDYQEWNEFYKGGYSDWIKTTWPPTARKVIGNVWPRLVMKQRFAMLRVNQCSVKPPDPVLEKYFFGGELYESPGKGTPCYDLFRPEYDAAIKLLNKPGLSEEERKELDENWPDFSEKKYCRLPCNLRGKFLNCP